MNVALKWVSNDLDLVAVWVLDYSVSTVETAARRRHRVDVELTEIGDKWTLSNCFANANRDKATGTVDSRVLFWDLCVRNSLKI
ncbi:Importin subunit beta-1 [Hordeum vulgare]|nr:Importin subunit beta-1 [Hordeum vulgare]